jgi:hypothetical protein
LRRAEIGERLLQRVKARVGREAFDGDDLAAVAFDAEDQAGENRLAVEQHGARAAFAQLAPVLRAAQAGVLAEHLQQRLVAVEGDLGPLAVDGDYDLGARHAGSCSNTSAVLSARPAAPVSRHPLTISNRPYPIVRKSQAELASSACL